MRRSDDRAAEQASPTSWFFYNDVTDEIDNTIGSFVSGPATTPAGSGSAQVSVTGTARSNLATYLFSGVALADITTMTFSTYNPSAGNGGGATRSALWSWSGGSTWPDGNTNQYRTWDDLLASFPGIAVRTTDSWLGLRVGEPYNSGYTENLDRFVFGTADGTTTTFDFEPLVGSPADKSECMKGGWEQFNNPSFANQGQCVQFVNTGK